MPRELVAVAPREPAYREYEDGPVPTGYVRLRSEFSAAKHGTELSLYRGVSPFADRVWDAKRQLFLPGEHGGGILGFPMALGNMTVGQIIELGEGAGRWRVGDRVFGWFGFRETHTVPENALYALPTELTPEEVVCWDPAEFALSAVRDALIRLGDTVVVFGMGAIGLLALQMARLSGAVWVAAVEPIEKRRGLAADYGADVAYDPRDIDVALAVRRDLGREGVDVTIEASGSYVALHEALRSCAFGGRCVPLAFYHGEARGLRLGEEWHMNRLDMISTRACSDPNREHPRWDDGRIRDTAFALIRQRRVKVTGIVDPVVDFEHALEAYRMIDERPEESVKLGVRYG